MEQKTLTVTITYQRRIKELHNIISQCEMMIEMSRAELVQLQNNAQEYMKNIEKKDTIPDPPITNN